MSNTTSIPKRTVEIELRGQKYTLTESTLADLVAFKSYLSSMRMKEVMDAAKDLSSGERILLISELMRRPVTEADVERESETFIGLFFMLWRALLPAHPGITLDSVYDLIGTDTGTINEIGAIMEGLARPDEGTAKNA